MIRAVTGSGGVLHQLGVDPTPRQTSVRPYASMRARNTPPRRLLNAASRISMPRPGTARIVSIAARMSTWWPRSSALGSGSGSWKADRHEVHEGDGDEGDRPVQGPSHPETADHQPAQHGRAHPSSRWWRRDAGTPVPCPLTSWPRRSWMTCRPRPWHELIGGRPSSRRCAPRRRRPPPPLPRAGGHRTCRWPRAVGDVCSWTPTGVLLPSLMNTVGGGVT